MKLPKPIFLIGLIYFVGLISSCTQTPKENELPNILWLVSEDNGAFLGCYGDTFATTPNLDKLASEGFLYTNAFANAPVCAPARNTIITGVYATSGGNQHMRSQYLKSDRVIPYPFFLREMGYYCTNNSKTDYNFSKNQYGEMWDESSNSAHYKNRKPGQPFFAIFNTGITHESSIHKSIPTDELKHDPDQVPIPPYHPRTEDMEHDWAQYYDKMENMDAWVGDHLQALEESGLADNTIVFYYSDHGGVLARSKRFLYETGTHVPFIVRIPKKYKHLFPNAKAGTKVDRMISFVDLAPTLLSIAGVDIPGFMQGDAFLGEKKTEGPDYAYMFRGRMDERYDMSRSIRDKKYRYTKNYMPHRIYGQYLSYLWRAPSIGSWEQAYQNGECNEAQSAFWEPKPAEELYDTEADPWEVNNLADDPNYKEVLERMRKANNDWVLEIKDAGFIPEPMREEMIGDEAAYDFMRSSNINLEAIVNAANVASMGNIENLNTMIEYLKSEEPAIRYWGATGLLILGEEAKPAIGELKKAALDSSSSVAIVAAEAIYQLGERELGEEVLLNMLDKNNFATTFALNSIDILNIDDQEAKSAVKGAMESLDHDYSLRAAGGLARKWGLEDQKDE